MQQVSRYDEAEILHMGKQEKIAKEQTQQITIRAPTGADQGGNIAEERAIRPDEHDSRGFSNHRQNRHHQEAHQDFKGEGPRQDATTTNQRTQNNGSFRSNTNTKTTTIRYDKR